MPVPADDLNAFDLQLFKALLNFKLNKSYRSDLTTEQKKDLCISYNKEGLVNIHPDYLNRIWTKRKGISTSISIGTLNQLCSIIRKGYQWQWFTAYVLKFKPAGISNKIAYSDLNRFEKEKIDKAIEDVFHHYLTYEDFEREVIDNNAVAKSLEKMNNASRNTDGELDVFASRIYVELTTRKAGIPIDEENDVIEEIYNSWYKLFCSIRDEMKLLPISYLRNSNSYLIIQLANKILNELLRPHLTEHQAKFRGWLENAKRNPKNKNLSPQQLQKKYPDYKYILDSLKKVNEELIESTKKFMQLY